ncbi:PQQ-binding-like beta-propeller repeat protein [Myxococcota bacterium]|nr:PQQ-binding-like beta-propeller repeat protein [Myxococcota bacterium]MBU1380034.1 PQQ-binding-like beta-propeller repeat protein [Myxococcota bacterium]MBU1496479.1 PQQ-binding-like beta-propeller repeat protein [Myxococcota bacterium]
MKFRYLLVSLLALSACKPPQKKDTKPVEPPKPTYPQINWKKALTGRVFVVADSQRRFFGIEMDEKNNPYSIVAFEKSSGVKKWTKDVELGLADPTDFRSYGIAVKGAALGFWLKNNTIRAVDKYRGVDMWDKKIQGIGLSVLGENFITAWETKIRLIDPETGKATDMDLGRKITAPIHITPKGYIVAITGDVAHLIDLENEKVNIRWSWEIDTEGGYSNGLFTSSDETLQVYQHTVSNQNLVHIQAVNLDKYNLSWKLKFAGIEGKPATFHRFGKMARFVVIPEGTTEKQWHLVDLETGKLGANPVFSPDDPPRRCVMSDVNSFCWDDKVVRFFETQTWKKIWESETIYGVNDAKHMLHGKNAILADGTRIKSFRSDGSTAFVFEPKAPNLKDPRVNQVITEVEGVLLLTVVDYTADKWTKKTKGELWAFDIASRKVKWKHPLDDAGSTIDSVHFCNETKKITVVSKNMVYNINPADGKKSVRRLRLKPFKGENTRVAANAQWTWVWNKNGVEIFTGEKLVQISMFNSSERTAPKGQTPLKDMTLASIDAENIYFNERNQKVVVAYELKKAKKIWTVKFDSILPPSVYATNGKIVVTSFNKTIILDQTGKQLKELPGYHRAFVQGKNLITFRKENLSPKPASRITAFKYDKAKAPVVAWKMAFKDLRGKDPLDGFDSDFPRWVFATPEYVFYPADGGRCIIALGALDGTETMKLCKGAWEWPPMPWGGRFYASTGRFQSKIPENQQGLIKFSLDKKWKQLLKMGKSDSKRYFNPQFGDIRRGTVFIQGTGEVLHSVTVAE